MAAQEKTKVGLDPAQLRAIEQQAQQGDVHGALERAERLAVTFPDHSGLRSLRAECLLQVGANLQASVLAWEWMAEHPNSLRAARVAADACLRAELPYLARRAAWRLAELGQPDPRVERESSELAQAFERLHPGLGAHNGVAMDAGLLYLRVGRYDKATEYLSQLDLPFARVNLAHARFRLGQTADARALLRPLTEADSPYPPALYAAIQYALYEGDDNQASACADRLAALTPDGPDILFQQLAGLLLAERPALVTELHDRFAPGFAGKRDDLSRADVANAAGVACAWLGLTVRAVQLFQQAAEIVPRDVVVQANLAYLLRPESGGVPFLVPADAWLPDSSRRAVQRALALLEGGLENLTANVHRLELDLPERSEFLSVMARQGDPVTRAIALELIGRRAERGEAAAIDCLKRHLRSRLANDYERAMAAGFLFYARALPQRTSLRAFLNDHEQDISVAVPSVGMAPDVLDLTQAQAARHAQAQERLAAGEMPAAAQILEALLRDASSRRAELALRHELATALHRIPGREADAQRLVAELLQASDCLPRTRAFHALLELDAGRLAQARAELEALPLDGEYWFFDAAALLYAWERVHHAAADSAGWFGIKCAQRGLGAFRFDSGAGAKPASAAGQAHASP
jgi:tetratricopeptide (TPR) repeat protein